MMSSRLKLILAGLLIVSSTLACSVLQPLPSSGIPTENPYLEIPRVTVEEAVAAYHTRAAVFVDVRSPTQYARSHIAGALSVPLDELIDGRTGELDPNDWIITYCT